MKTAINRDSFPGKKAPSAALTFFFVTGFYPPVPAHISTHRPALFLFRGTVCDRQLLSAEIAPSKPLPEDGINKNTVSAPCVNNFFSFET